jgi:antitoxin MazE
MSQSGRGSALTLTARAGECILIVDSGGTVKTKIQKWGNSLALRIPRPLAEDANVRIGSTVELRLHEGRLVIEPAEQSRYELEQLLAGVEEANLHDEVSFEPPVGREAW